MPANLPPDYFAAEKQYRQANSPEEKIVCLRAMLAVMPKHKGTEHLQGDLKRRIAKLNSQAQKKQATSRASGLDHIPREGAGQVIMLGAPNSGKSSILNYFTNAHSNVESFPFSTFKPVQGMMAFEDVQIQLIDLPPVSIRHTESYIFNIARLANCILLVVDLSEEEPHKQVLEIISIMESHKVKLDAEGEDRPQGSVAVKKTILLGTKSDLPGAESGFRLIHHHLGEKFLFITLSIQAQSHVDLFRETVFRSLNVIRVYTKIPGKKADMETPYMLPTGSTVLEAARTIHKDLSESMRYARLWDSYGNAGRRVERDHLLSDKDILEIHT